MKKEDELKYIEFYKNEPDIITLCRRIRLIESYYNGVLDVQSQYLQYGVRMINIVAIGEEYIFGFEEDFLGDKKRAMRIGEKLFFKAKIKHNSKGYNFTVNGRSFYITQFKEVGAVN